MPKNRKINLGIIFGGKSGEHEVSLGSFISVMRFIDKNKYNIIPIGINKKGKWIMGNRAYTLLNNAQRKIIHTIIPDNQPKNSSAKSQTKIFNNTQIKNIDIIFPVLHGTYGEDGTLQGLLEIADIPYIGSGVLGSALGMDKIVQKELYGFHKMPQTKFYWFLYKDWKKNKNLIIKNIVRKLRFPLFIKPANLGSSVGISKIKNKKQLVRAVHIARSYDSKILIEQGIEGVREIECSILGNDYPKASILGEIIPSNEFYDYDAKYRNGKTQMVIPAKIPKKISKKIQRLALDAFKILNLSGLARIDFFLRRKDNAIFINEVNTLPGLTIMYPKLWEASGLSYTKLIDELIVLSFKRYEEKKQLKTSFTAKS